MAFYRLSIPAVLIGFGLGMTYAHRAVAAEPRFEFTRMVAHWSQYGEPEYLDFVDQAKPELVQLGFYGGHFWSLSHTPQFAGYPAHFPVQGISECSKWFREKNRELRKRKIKVIGHFNVEFLMGEPDGPDGPRGFFKFYRELWDEDLLGPKPVEDPLDFVEKDKDGRPMPIGKYSVGKMHEYYACLRNPNWQQVLKAWVSVGIAQGVDGFIANYFYRHDCHCEHCQRDFRKYLEQRHDAAGLEALGIDDLKSHVFDEIVAWHPPEESTPLRREMLRWSQISNKQVFDEVFIKHGRSLKSDLIVAQWNHLSDFNQIKGDERCLLPAGLWGKGEDYLWYSTGASAVYTDLKNGVLGDATLQARYVRGAFDDKPFTLGKYEGVRTRSAIAELAANGGSPMGFYAKFPDPDARQVFRDYYGFIEDYHQIFHANQSMAEVVLLYPRLAVHAGDLEPLEAFKIAGRRLLDEHVLFDVVPDDIFDPDKAAGRYVTIVDPSIDDGGLSDRVRTELSAIEAGPFVRASVSRPAGGGEIDIHLVNYDRRELPPKKNGRPDPGRGTGDENPIASRPVQVSYRLNNDDGKMVGAVEVITPEADAVSVPFDRDGDRIRFEVPGFLVYAIARMKLVNEEPEALPKVAAATTVYHHNSHADVLLSRITESDSLDWTGRHPNLRLGSVYIDQYPERDIGKAHSAKYGFPLVKSVREALTEGGDQLAVDGVMLIAEHGEYPVSDTEQIVYPKRRLFGEVIETFRATGKVLPVFSDKHLADNWADAKWIYDQSKAMKFPLMAGSSVPGLWRYPATDVKRGAKLKEIVGISYGPIDAYSFHGLEAMQSLVERRSGGETGVKRVRCITGAEVWTSDWYDRELFEQALDRQERQQYLRRRPLEEAVKEPVLFVIDYEDGLRASMVVLNGAAANWTAAWRYADDTTPQIDSTLFWTQELRPYFHFAIFLRNIESMLHSGETPWPVERTLLTTGLLDALLISRRDGGDWLDTPYLKFDYQSHWNWHQPPPPPRGRPHTEQ